MPINLRPYKTIKNPSLVDFLNSYQLLLSQVYGVKLGIADIRICIDK